MYEALIPARLEFGPAGTAYSRHYGDVYYSEEGGPGQAHHVFLQGNGLPERWQARSRFTLLETGFGTGLNFLATWLAWREQPGLCRRLHYISVEKHPFSAGDLATLHRQWPEFTPLAAQLRALWPTLAPGFHRLEFDNGGLILTLLFGEAGRLLPKLTASVDCFYLDGFAPSRNPELWSAPLLGQLGRLANRDATLATWSVSVPVRELLHAAGFDTDKRPGFGRKREMLVGRFRLHRSEPLPPERRALVVGAGVAGSTCCERLANRGWDITLIDRQPAPGMEASGNLAGILMPLVSRDDNIASRLSRAAYLHALRFWQTPEVRAAGARFSACGVVQFARTQEQETLMRQTAEQLALPEVFIRHLTQQACEEHLGYPAPAGGWLFEQGGWANPPSLCRAALQMAGQALKTHFESHVSRIERVGGTWRALDGDGHCLAEAPHLILAGGASVTGLEQAGHLPIRSVRGQVTLLPEGTLPTLRSALCGDGYATPAVDGRHAVGASYDLATDPAPWPASDAENLLRLQGLIPGLAIVPGQSVRESRVGFRPVAPDRLPLCGTLPDWRDLPESTATRLRELPTQTGLHGLLGYASRGLVWANLLAENLICQLEGEPLPLESDLRDAVDPRRFILRHIRKRRPAEKKPGHAGRATEER